MDASWIMKKTEPRELMLQIVVLEKTTLPPPLFSSLENTSESPLDTRRSNQSVLKQINPEYSLLGLMLKLQSFGHLMGRAGSRKDPDAGKD